VKYDGTYEDLFFYVERLVIQACGEDIAGRLHTARSRNDIDMTMYRMRQRELVLGLFTATFELRRSLLDLVDHIAIPSWRPHPHPARAPTTVAHYLLAVIEQLERDAARLEGAYEHTNHNPLGAARSPARLSDRSAVDLGAAWILRSDGQHLRQHRHGRLSPREHLGSRVLLVGHGRFVQDCCCVQRGVRLCALR